MELFSLISQSRISDFGDIFGVLGVTIYLASYFALQIGLIRGQGFTYPFLNILAAGSVLYSLQTNFNLSAALIQISFVAISTIGLLRNWLSDYLLFLKEDEKRLLASKFPGLRGFRARRILDSGHWKHLPAGTVLTREGEISGELFYIASGAVTVYSEDTCLFRYERDVFIGEISCLSGQPSTATTIVAEAAYALCISSARIRKIARRDSEIRRHLDDCFSREIRQKVLQKHVNFRNIVRRQPMETAGGVALPEAHDRLCG